jgi:microcystin-dependent protein
VLANGAAISRTGFPTLFNLYNAMGLPYGIGDGSTTFNVPDLSGRMPIGLGTHSDVSSLGLNEGASVANRRAKHAHANALSATLPNHGHSITDPGHTHTTAAGNGTGSSIVYVQSNTNNFPSTSSSATTGITVGNPTSNPAITISGSIGAAGLTDGSAYLVVNFIIKT